MLQFGSVIGQNHLIEISFGDRSVVASPFKSIADKKLYPAVAVEFKIKVLEKVRWNIEQGAMLSYHYHKYIGNNYAIASGTTSRYKIRNRHCIELQVLLGYNINQPVERSFKFINGKYIEQKMYKSMMLIGCGLRYSIKVLNNHRVYIGYQYSLFFPFNNTIRLLPMENIVIGYNLPLRRKNEK